MAERFIKVFSLADNLYANGSPLIITAGILVKDNKENKILCQLKLKNIENKNIKAVKVNIQTYDVAKNLIDEKIQHQYLDLNLNFNSEFVDKKGLLLNNEAREFNISITEVLYDDNSVKNLSSESFDPLPVPEKLTFGLDSELADQYVRNIGKIAKYIPSEHKDLWCCTCGKYNHEYENVCHSCKTDKAKQFANYDVSILQTNLSTYKNRLKEKEAEKEKQEAIAKKEAEKKEAEKKKKLKKILAGFISVVCVVIVIFGIAGGINRKTIAQDIIGREFIGTDRYFDSSREDIILKIIDEDYCIMFIDYEGEYEEYYRVYKIPYDVKGSIFKVYLNFDKKNAYNTDTGEKVKYMAPREPFEIVKKEDKYVLKTEDWDGQGVTLK